MRRKKDHQQLAGRHKKSKFLKRFSRIRITDSMDQKVSKDIAKLKENDIYNDEVSMLHPAFCMFTIHHLSSFNYEMS